MKDFDAMLLTVVRQRQRAGRVPAAADHALLHRRRGGRRPPGRGGAGQRAPRGVRGRHRGRGRGRRLQHHRPRPADLPHRGRREGHGLDEADRPRPRRPRVDGERRQRGGPAERRGRAARRPRVADPADADHGGAARHGRRAVRHRGHARRTPRTLVDEFGGATRMLGAVISNTVNPTMLSAGYKVNVVPTTATAHVDARSLPGLRGRVLRHPERADRRGHRRRVPVQPATLGDAVRRRAWSTRCTAACWPRTRTRSSRRTS